MADVSRLELHSDDADDKSPYSVYLMWIREGVIVSGVFMAFSMDTHRAGIM